MSYNIIIRNDKLIINGEVIRSPIKLGLCQKWKHFLEHHDKYNIEYRWLVKKRFNSTLYAHIIKNYPQVSKYFCDVDQIFLWHKRNLALRLALWNTHKVRKFLIQYLKQVGYDKPIDTERTLGTVSDYFIERIEKAYKEGKHSIVKSKLGRELKQDIKQQIIENIEEARKSSGIVDLVEIDITDRKYLEAITQVYEFYQTTGIDKILEEYKQILKKVDEIALENEDKIKLNTRRLLPRCKREEKRCK